MTATKFLRDSCSVQQAQALAFLAILEEVGNTAAGLTETRGSRHRRPLLWDRDAHSCITGEADALLLVKTQNRERVGSVLIRLPSSSWLSAI